MQRAGFLRLLALSCAASLSFLISQTVSLSMRLCSTLFSIPGEQEKIFFENMPPFYTRIIEMSIPNFNYFLKKFGKLQNLFKEASLRNLCNRQSLEKRINRSGYILENGEKDFYPMPVISGSMLFYCTFSSDIEAGKIKKQMELPGGKNDSLENTNSGNGDHKESTDEHL